MLPDRSRVPNLFGLGLLISTLIAAHGAWECAADDPVGCCAPTGAKAPHDGELPVTNSVSLEGIEIIQAVQDVGHSVPILARKRTLVRVYLSAQTATGYGILNGEITVTPLGGGVPVTVPSARLVSVWDQWNGNWKTFKRQRIHTSLNFELPEEVLKEGNYVVEVTKIIDWPRGTTQVGCANCQGLLRRYSAVRTVPLRLRVLGLKYNQNGSDHFPRRLDYESIKSWLLRAYPVNDVYQSTRTIQWPGQVPFLAPAANDFVLKVRIQEIAHGVDCRTHYYGLVYDGGFPFRGASRRPPTPDPACPGSGPAGAPTGQRQSWDEDGSYADHYAGHELGHPLGQRHVGGVCGESGVNLDYPFPMGCLSFDDPERVFMGFDWGDPTLGIRRQSLDGTFWHDVMSYCPYSWLSSYTYCRIRDQLLAEDAFCCGSGPLRIVISGGARALEPERQARLVEGTPMIVVLGTVDYQNATGQITSVNMVNRASVGQSGTRVKCIAYAADGTTLSAPATEYLDDDGTTGLVMSVLPADGINRIELVLDGKVLDTRRASMTRPQFDGAFGRESADGRVAAVTWKATDADGDKLSYSVLMKDGDAPWETVLLDSTEPRLEISSLELPKEREQVQIKVLVTDGFYTTEKTETVPLAAVR